MDQLDFNKTQFLIEFNNNQPLVDFNKKCGKFLGYKYTQNYQWYDEGEFLWVDVVDEWVALGIFYHEDDFSESEHGYIRVDGKVLNNYHYDLDKFSKDLNWLMKVKNKICNMDIVYEFETTFNNMYYCHIRQAYKDSFGTIYGEQYPTELEATIDVIDKFLDYVNK